MVKAGGGDRGLYRCDVHVYKWVIDSPEGQSLSSRVLARLMKIRVEEECVDFATALSCSRLAPVIISTTFSARCDRKGQLGSRPRGQIIARTSRRGEFFFVSYRLGREFWIRAAHSEAWDRVDLTRSVKKTAMHFFQGSLMVYIHFINFIINGQKPLSSNERSSRSIQLQNSS